MLNEITKKEFEERYPEVSTYGLEAYSPVYLENGVVLIDKEWNGEVYTVKDEEGKERTYRPVQEPDEVDDDGEVLQWKTTCLLPLPSAVLTTTAKFYSGKQLATKKSFRKEEPRQAAALLGFFILY